MREQEPAKQRAELLENGRSPSGTWRLDTKGSGIPDRERGEHFSSRTKFASSSCSPAKKKNKRGENEDNIALSRSLRTLTFAPTKLASVHVFRASTCAQDLAFTVKRPRDWQRCAETTALGWDTVELEQGTKPRQQATKRAAPHPPHSPHSPAKVSRATCVTGLLFPHNPNQQRLQLLLQSLPPQRSLPIKELAKALLHLPFALVNKTLAAVARVHV